jgi:hypothetical protein
VAGQLNAAPFVMRHYEALLLHELIGDDSFPSNRLDLENRLATWSNVTSLIRQSTVATRLKVASAYSVGSCVIFERANSIS